MAQVALNRSHSSVCSAFIDFLKVLFNQSLPEDLNDPGEESRAVHSFSWNAASRRVAFDFLGCEFIRVLTTESSCTMKQGEGEQ